MAANILRPTFPPIPADRRPCRADLHNLPEGVVALRPPLMPPEPEPVRLSAEMEAIHALVQVLDQRTASGRRSSAKVRDRLFAQLTKAYFGSDAGTARRWATNRAMGKLVDADQLDRGHIRSPEA